MNRHLRSRLKQRWPRLTDGDLETVDGQATRLLGFLQEKYGYPRQRAERELLAFLDDSLPAGPLHPVLRARARVPIEQPDAPGELACPVAEPHAPRRGNRNLMLP